MKHVFLLFLAFLLGFTLPAQDIELTFTGSGAATSVETVKVVYLSKGDTIDINGADVLKLVSKLTGVCSPLPDGLSLLVYPNPVRDEGSIRFHSPQAGIVHLELYNHSGRMVTRSSHALQAGEHSFSISGLNQGIYTLRACMPGHIVSLRIVSVEIKPGFPVLKHESSAISSDATAVLKSRKAVVELLYTPGDYLLLKGVGGNHKRIVTIAPTESQVVNFEFIACADADGNHYPVVSIGTQTWMAENLRTSRFNDNTEIEHVDSDIWWRFTGQPGYCWVNNDQDNFGYYGKLYNWYVGGGVKNPCPQGWHVPSHEEYMIFHNYLTDNGYAIGSDDSLDPDRYGFAGKAIAHIILWEPYPKTGTVGNNLLLNNITGLSLIPNGSRRADGESFSKTGEWCFLWLSTQLGDDLNAGWNVIVRNDTPRHENHGSEKRRGAAIRCIKD